MQIIWRGCLVSVLFLLATPSFAHQPVKNVEVQAMSPLLVYDPRTNPTEAQINEALDKFSNKLKRLKEMGVSSVSVDVWWGLVQAESREAAPDWSYYEKIFDRIVKADLNIVAILSFHQCGGNVGDGGTYIPIPKWVRNLLPTLANGQDARYKSELGNYSEEVVSSFATNVEREAGKPHILDFYGEFARAFQSKFSPIAHKFREIVVGTGPAGELTAPSYHRHDENIRYNEATKSYENQSVAAVPGRGALQASSPLAIMMIQRGLQAKYQNIDSLNAVWKTAYASFDQIDFFSTHEKFEAFLSIKGPSSIQGQDFFSIYNDIFINHGVKVASEVATAFKGTNFQPVELGIKTPGIHWNFDSGISLLTAGQVTSIHGEEYGYANTLQKLFGKLTSLHPQTKWKSIFTCADQANGHRQDVDGPGDQYYDGRKIYGAYDLVRAVGRVLDRLGVHGGIENSLAHLLWLPQAVNRMLSHLNDLHAFSSVTLLRMDEVIDSPEAGKFVREAQQVGRKKPPTPPPPAGPKGSCSEALTL